MIAICFPSFLRYVPFFLACEQFALPKAANAMEVMTLRGLGQEIVAKCSGATQKKRICLVIQIIIYY